MFTKVTRQSTLNGTPDLNDIPDVQVTRQGKLSCTTYLDDQKGTRNVIKTCVTRKGTLNCKKTCVTRKGTLNSKRGTSN